MITRYSYAIGKKNQQNECLLVCRVPSKPLTVSQKTRTTSCSSSDETSDGDEDSDESNTSDDDENDVSVAVELPPPILDKITEPADDSAQQVIYGVIM